MKIICSTHRCYPYNVQYVPHTHTNLCVLTKIVSHSFITCSFFFSEYIISIFQVNKCTSAQFLKSEEDHVVMATP